MEEAGHRHRGNDPDESRVVFHVDMDAFYAAVEVRDNPALRGLPLVVGADPKGGRGRGVVCTASYEARRFGIRSAMPISQAYRAAPHAVFVRPDFRRYSEASGKVMGILARYADVLEVVGMDEAYLDVTERVRGDGGAPDWDLASSLARSLQAAVKRELGLSCSVGIAPSKSVAKVASDARKPHGVFRLRPHEVMPYLDPLPTGKLHGCGPKTAAALRDEGIRTIGELARMPKADLERRFGAHGLWLHRVANADDPRPVDGERGQRKSRGNETTFPRDEPDPEEVARVAARLLDELLDEQGRRDGRAFATLAVKVRYSGFATVTRSRTLDHPILAGDPLAAATAHAAIQAILAPLLDGRAVRLVGVRLSGFLDVGGQRGLSAFGLAWAGLQAPLLRITHMATARFPHAFNPGGLAWTSLASFAAPSAFPMAGNVPGIKI